MLKYNSCLLVALLIATTLQAQLISISAARASATGTVVTVKGIVTHGAEFGAIRYFQDGTGGLAAYSTSLMAPVKIGDSMEVTGTLKSYNNLLELDPVSSVTIINSGNPLPAPLELATLSAFTEPYEGILVRVKNVVVPGTGTFSASTNYNLDGNASTQIRINPGTDIPGKQIPSSACDITGIMSQFSFSSPSTGYQLLPRTYNDFQLDNGPKITSSLAQQNITSTGFDVLFNTQDPGSTTIRYGLTSLLELGSLTDTAKATSHRTTLSGLQPATFYYVKAVSLKPNGDSSVTSPVLMSTASLSSGTIRVLFSRDVRNDLTTFTPAVYAPQSIDDTIIAYITRCKGTLDIAMYNWNNNSLSDITAAVNDAYDRGVKVRLVYDGGNANLGLGTLNPNIGKIASPQTSSYTIMHNKFMIVDANSTNPNDPFVFTGSTNWTNGQINSDANNQVIIQDQALARAYTIEFEEMFGSNGLNPNTSNARFGQFKTNNTPHQFMIGGKQVEQYFSPSDNVNQQLINAIKSANTDLCFQILTFTRRDVALAIAGRASAGVFAAGMIDDTANGSAGFFDMKAVMGGNVIKYAGPGLIHHKMAVADANNYYSDPLVLTGSHNWSNSADSRNDENTVIIHDAGIANQFFQEFAKQSGLYGIPTGWGFANFMVDSLTIRQNHQVSFTDLSVFNDVVPKASSHTWNFGDGQTSNLPAPKHAYANPGKYTVSLIAGNGTVTDTITQELLITVIPNTGVPQGAVAQNIRFFPNPVKTTGIIEADDAGAHSFIIYSILGQTMLSGRFTGELTIDASGFAPGVYLVSVDGVSGLKFIKE